MHDPVASESKTAVFAALVGNLIIALLKLGAGLLARSAAMLAEAAHSFSDVGNQLLLMLGLSRSRSGPTPKHPFGTGKSSYFWPFLVAVLLFGVAGAYSVLEGIEKIRHPHALGDIRLSLAVLGVAFVIEGATLWVALRGARRVARRQGLTRMRDFLRDNRDATLLTVIVEDGLALVGLPIAAASLLLSQATGNPVWDGVGSLVIGLLLMGFALFLGSEVRLLLIGRGLSEHDVAAVERVVCDDPDVEALVAVQSMYLGSDAVLLGVDVEFRDELDLMATERAVQRIEQALRAAIPALRFVFIEPRAATNLLGT